jgi:Domain of unknown function (DUF1707)
MGKAPVMAGPGNEIAAEAGDRAHLRGPHADREQVIGMLKAAFVAGMLAKDEFDLRVEQAFGSRTYAGLAAVTADLPAGLAAAGPARPPVRVGRRPLAKAAAGAGGCLTIAAAAVWGAGILDPGPFARSTSGSPGFPSPGLMFVIALYAVLAALGFLAFGMSTALRQRRSRRQLPPRPRLSGHVHGEQGGGTGHGPVPPDPCTGQARADLRASKPPQRIPTRAARAPRSVRPAGGAPGIPVPVPGAT